MGGTDYGNGFFYCPGYGNQCGPPGPYFDVGVDATSETISFTAYANGGGLVFFVVEPEEQGPQGPIIDNVVTLTAAPYVPGPTPEPRLWPVLGLAIAGLLLFRRRSGKLA
jgi:hypothetical protein